MLPRPDTPPRTSTSTHLWDRGRFERVTRAPHPAVAPSVVGPYEAFTARTEVVLRRREAAVAFVPLILNLGEPFLVSPGGEAVAPERHSSFAAGLHDRSSIVEGARRSTCIQVNLEPLAARRILAVAMGEVVNRTVALDELLGSAGRGLVERLGNLSSWAQRFDEIDRFLYERLRRGPAPAEPVRWAWDRLRHSSGGVQIGELTREIGWSHKHLIRRFHLDVGLSPKSAARVIRFGGLLRRLDSASSTEIRWSEAALSCGYYDQAHLIRDFRAMAGTTPTEYVASRIPGGGGVAAPS